MAHNIDQLYIIAAVVYRVKKLKEIGGGGGGGTPYDCLKVYLIFNIFMKS